MSNTTTWILALGLVVAGALYAITTRYELEAVGYSTPRSGRSTAWRLDRWTGEVCTVTTPPAVGAMRCAENR